MNKESIIEEVIPFRFSTENMSKSKRNAFVYEDESGKIFILLKKGIKFSIKKKRLEFA